MLKMPNLKASTLRLIMIVSLFLIAGLAVVMFYFANQELSKVATEVSHVTADAEASQDNLQNLQAVEQKLANEKEAIERVNSIVAESQSYQYQDQILSDLHSYANQSGVTITNINFSGSGDSTASSSGTPPVSSAPAGLKTTSVSVTIDNPVGYNNLLRFMRSIEQNLTKMQISTVSLSKAESGSQVTSDALTIEVYIR